MVIEQDLGGAIPEIKTNVWPAFPTDLTSIAITVATQASGDGPVPRLDVPRPDVLHR